MPASLGDDFIIEKVCRAFPKCLQLPSLEAKELVSQFYLHVLRLSASAAGPLKDQPGQRFLGLLLPSRLGFAVELFVPGKAVNCFLEPLASEPHSFSEEELEAVATWSQAAAAMFQVPLLPLARSVAPGATSLHMMQKSGSYRVITPALDHPEPKDQPYCVMVPLLAMSNGNLFIDFPLLRLGLQTFALNEFPPLVDGLQTESGLWCSQDTEIRFDTIIVTAVMKGRRDLLRDHFVTDLRIDEAADSVDFGHHVHRSFLHCGASSYELPQQRELAAKGPIKLSECKVVTTTSSLADAILCVPAVLWHLEHSLCSSELQEELLSMTPPIRVDVALLGRALLRSGISVGRRLDATDSGLLSEALRLAGPDSERLEFLGDALLKLASSFHAFAYLQEANEHQLTVAVKHSVNNDYLRAVARCLAMPPRILSRSFERSAGVLENLRTQDLPWKANSDTLEATIAAIWLTARRSSSASCPVAQRAIQDFFENHIIPSARHFPDNVHGLQAEHGKLRKQNEMQRCEFLGDAALQALVSVQLFVTMPEAKAGELTMARSLLLCNDYLAFLAIQRYDTIQDPQTLDIARSTLQFLATQKPRYDSKAGFLRRMADAKTPAASLRKCLADHYETQVGSKLCESLGQLNSVWPYFEADFDIPADLLMEVLRLRKDNNDALSCSKNVTVKCDLKDPQIQDPQDLQVGVPSAASASSPPEETTSVAQMATTEFGDVLLVRLTYQNGKAKSKDILMPAWKTIKEVISDYAPTALSSLGEASVLVFHGESLAARDATLLSLHTSATGPLELKFAAKQSFALAELD